MSMEQGWSALNSGDAARAADIFEQLAMSEGGIGAYTGLVRANLAMGDHDQAMGWAQHAAGELGGTDGALLMAQVMSERSKRAEAARLLQSVLNQEPNNAFALALMAEQRIRQGYWDDGTQRFIEAIAVDTRGEAFVHLQKVLADLVDAVIARRVKPVDAIKFVNLVDYNAPKSNPELSPFLALARRSLNTGSPLARPSASPPSPSAPTPAASAPARQRPSPPSTPRSQQAAQQAAQRQASMRERPNAPNTQRRMEPLRAGVQTDFMKMMRQDRVLNEELQKTLGTLRPSTWPSALDEPLDEIPAIGFSGSTISEQVQAKRQLEFHVTEGSLTSQIYLERAVNALMLTIPVELTGTLQMMPEELAMLDMNCADGLLGQMGDLITEDLGEDFEEPSNPQVSALGMYLGQCIVNGHGGCWKFASAPLDSHVQVGNDTFRPFETAASWLKSPHTVSFQDLMGDADDAKPDQQLGAKAYEHIDLTAGLTGRALTLKLAELYSFFRFALVRVQPYEIMEGMEVLHEGPASVVFSIQKRWLPEVDAPTLERGRRKGGTYALAYTRRTGEFWILGRLKDLENALPSLFGTTLDASTSARMLEILSEFHSPGARVVKTQKDAQRLQSKGANGAAAPAIMKTQGGNLAMVYWVLEGSNAIRRILEVAPQYSHPWGFLT